jgi:hypothetical protein
MPNPKELTRAEVIQAASTFRWTRKMPKWRVVVNSRELPARPLVLEAAGVPPNDTTNSHQAVAILEKLGFETRYCRENPRFEHEKQHSRDTQEVEPVFKAILRMAQQVPPSEWARVPTDLSKNLDQYLYGKKKSR